jgi:hypothetical protein
MVEILIGKIQRPYLVQFHPRTRNRSENGADACDALYGTTP